MKSGKCPKCGSATVYSKDNATAHGSIRGIQVYAKQVHWATTLTYICTTCGYYEHYISEPPVLAEVAKDWTKVPIE